MPSSASADAQRASSHFPFASSLTFQQAKEICSPDRCQRLLTRIRGNAILFVLKRQKGFRDGNVEGALFFCALRFLLLFLFRTVRFIKRRQLLEHEGRKVRRRLPIDHDFHLRLALLHLRQALASRGCSNFPSQLYLRLRA